MREKSSINNEIFRDREFELLDELAEIKAEISASQERLKYLEGKLDNHLEKLKKHFSGDKSWTAKC